MLTETAEYKLPLGSMDGLAMALSLTTDRFKELLEASFELNLLTTDGDCFFSPSLTRRKANWEQRRSKLAANAKQSRSKSEAKAKQNLSKVEANGDFTPSPLGSPLPLSLSPSLLAEEIQGSEEIVVQERAPAMLTRGAPYENPDTRGNERKPHPKFPKIWLSELEISSLEKRFDKVGLRKEFWEQCYANVEQWFTDTAKGRKEYSKSSNHMRRVANWGLTAALKLQRESDYAKQATARLR